MFKKNFYDQRGFTLMELMISIGLIVAISMISILFIQKNPDDEVDRTTNQVLSDLRYARSLAVSRTVYDFDGAGPNPAIYPPGGYGIYINRLPNPDQYIIFAESGDADGYNVNNDGTLKIASTVTPIELRDANNPNATSAYFTFKSEKEAATNLAPSGGGQYQLEIGDIDTGPYYRGLLKLGEDSDDGYILVSLGFGFASYTPVVLCKEAGGTCETILDCCNQTVGASCTGVPKKCTDPVVVPPPIEDKSCFPAGTKVLMADYSSKNIEDVKIGDHIVSYDEKLKKEVTAKVLELAAPIRNHMCEIVFADNDSIKLTNEHPVYTKEGWKSINPEETARENIESIVGNLNIGDEVLFVGDNYKEITKINCWKDNIQTYTLQSVEGYGTFFAEDILVHNGTVCGGGVAF